LYINPDEYIFKNYNELSFENINSKVIYVVAFIVILYILSITVPKKMALIKPSKKEYKWLFKINYILAAVFIGYNFIFGIFMGGGTDTIAARVSFGLVMSILPLSLLAFILIIYADQFKYNRLLVFLPFIASSVLYGSKAALIFIFLYLIAYKLLIRERIVDAKNVILFIIAIVLYPIVSIYSYYIRLREANLILFINESLDHLFNSDISYFKILISSLSNRITAIDIFSLDPIKTSWLLDVDGTIIYFLKGIFVAQIVDLYVVHSTFSVGRVFAIEYLGQNVDVSNAFEMTLLGNILLSGTQTATACFVFLLVTSTFLLMRYLSDHKKWYFQIMYLYYLLQIVILIMTGNIQELGFILRLTFTLFLTSVLIKSINFNSKKNENSIYK
jgi:hypothetical protein